MPREEFEKLVAEEFPSSVPEKFRDKIKNVAFLVEDEPSPALRRAEQLSPRQTLLGHYRGIPHTARGDYYGVGGTLPDTITLFRIPIENQADTLMSIEIEPAHQGVSRVDFVRKVIRDTIWHEVAHHFGMDEPEVRRREGKRRK